MNLETTQEYHIERAKKATKSEKPILFSSPMVRAILDGRKTMTRRVMKLPRWAESFDEWTGTEALAVCHETGCSARIHCPYGETGDRLWVRETFTYWEHPESGEDFLEYIADNHRRSESEWPYPHPIYDHCVGRFGKKIPSIFMPRWASRITLEVTDVRVERLQEITEADAVAEGFALDGDGVTALENFATLWEQLNLLRGYGWDLNPYVWVVSFKRIK